ncbi:hypothetical protein LWI28_000931 [Acer negundo]|uniref:Uncharacterized protein n=1 Tax=Acer negundo TaxID=4023 RepID=A0AAD5NHS0_ACENE|nr:hypothetical protein LWI28_000931 [Acer negundo]
MPRKVAMAIPKMPARIVGTTREPQPLAVAMVHAVVGPPMLAFDARSNSFKSSNLNYSKQENTRCCVDDIPYAPTSTHHSEKYLLRKITSRETFIRTCCTDIIA